MLYLLFLFYCQSVGWISEALSDILFGYVTVRCGITNTLVSFLPLVEMTLF